MSKQWNPQRHTVELRPSRIRREPPPFVAPKELNPYPTERETMTVVVGVVMFAVAIMIIIIGVSDYTA